MVAEVARGDEAGKQSEKKPRQKANANVSALESMSRADLHTLRLDEDALTKFDARVRRFSSSTAELQTFEGEDIGSMDEACYDQLSAAQTKQANDATAMVQFLAPRILRLRDGAAKRKWRSFLTKFRKNEKLV